MMDSPKRTAHRTTQATFPTHECLAIASKPPAKRIQSPNVWKEHTQVSLTSNNNTLLESTIPLNIQHLFDGVRASNKKSNNLSAEAIAVATGVATTLGSVTNRMEHMERTVEQINKNAQKTTKILAPYSLLFTTILKKLNILTTTY